MQRASGTVRRMWDASKTSWKAHAELRKKETHVCFRMCVQKFTCMCAWEISTPFGIRRIWEGVYTWSNCRIRPSVNANLDSSGGGLRDNKMHLHLWLSHLVGQATYVNFTPLKWKYVGCLSASQLQWILMNETHGWRNHKNKTLIEAKRVFNRKCHTGINLKYVINNLK